jgi:RND family efflux transporter MFP subunit
MGSIESTRVARAPGMSLPGTGAIMGGTRAKVLAGAAVVLIVAGGLVASRVNSPPAAAPIRTAPVTRGTVTQVVQVSGSVNPATQTRLNFKTPGRLAQVLVAVGQQVAAGQALAQLDPVDLQNTVAQARANLAEAQAKYGQTVAGAAPEDIAVAKQAVDSAQKTLNETKRSTATDLTTAQQSFTKLKSAYASAQSGFQLYAGALPTDVSTFSTSIDSARSINATAQMDLMIKWSTDIASARSSVGQADSALVNAQTVAGTQLANTLTEWRSARDSVIAAWQQFDTAVGQGTDTSGAVTAYQSAQLAYATATSHLQSAISSVSASVTSAQTAVSSAQAALNSSNSATDPDLAKARADLAGEQGALASESQLATTINSKLSQMTTNLATITDAVGGSYVAAQQSVTSTQEKSNGSILGAQNSYDGAVATLNKTAAPPKSYDIAAAYASVLVEQAALDKATSDLSSATLAAPTAGVIASISSQPGEFVPGGTSANALITLSDTSTIALHGTVGESDVAKLKLGQVATVTVDAIGSSAKLTGRVTSLDPVATIQQGVPVYGVDVTIDVPDPAIRAGMTGTANVIVASKQDVVTVPNLAIRSQNGRRYVQVLRNGKAEDVDATFGIANDSVTEVTSGLQPGDQVILPAPRAGASGQQNQFRGPGGDRGPVIVGGRGG